MSIKPVDYQISIPRSVDTEKARDSQLRKQHVDQQVNTANNQQTTENTVKTVNQKRSTENLRLEEKQEKNQGNKKQKKENEEEKSEEAEKKIKKNVGGKFDIRI